MNSIARARKVVTLLFVGVVFFACRDNTSSNGGDRDADSTDDTDIVSDGDVDACIPQSCEELGKQCGLWDDGCQNQFDCGNCSSGSVCDEDGQCQECDGLALYGTCYVICSSSIDPAGCHSPSFALDSNDQPHIVYFGREGIDVRYARIVDSEWEIHIVDGETQQAFGASIAVDSLDQVHISYPYNRILKYAFRSGSEWELQEVDPEKRSAGSVCIDIDSNDNPHIVYSNNAGTTLNYAKWSGSTWEFQSFKTTSVITDDRFFSLDPNDSPYAVYEEYVRYPSVDLNYILFTDSGVDSQLIDPLDSTTVAGSFLVFDSSGSPHISYDVIEGAWGYEVKYARLVEGSWDIQTIDKNEYYNYSSSIALDSNDHPHISYHISSEDWSYGEMRYAIWTGSDWDIQTIVIEPTNSTGHLSLDSSDLPHIVYYAMFSGEMTYTWLSEDGDCSL